VVAISPNNAEVHVYEVKSWTCLHVLKEHDLLVSAVDWSVDNKIVTCSHDRNAFVWTFSADDNLWKPMLVILRVERAAMQVRWSTDGKKFAVATGAKSVSMCTYDESNDWWVSNAIKKKFKSTVLCCEFHPTNSQLLATGSSDFRCRIYSTFTSEVDGATVNAAPFANALEFGEAYCELATLGWYVSDADADADTDTDTDTDTIY
jgi:actin related protein 2/3 complex subunit 1A/1B